jgi:hypothetical protein
MFSRWSQADQALIGVREYKLKRITSSELGQFEECIQHITTLSHSSLELVTSAAIIRDDDGDGDQWPTFQLICAQLERVFLRSSLKDFGAFDHP